MHNSGQIDFLVSFQSDEFLDLPDQNVLTLLDLLQRTFPSIECSTSEALAVVRFVHDVSRNNGREYLVHQALEGWLQALTSRPSEALDLLLSDINSLAVFLTTVLSAGAQFDARSFCEHALDLSTRNESHLRQGALRSLGRVTPIDEGVLLDRTFQRLQLAVETENDNDAAIALDASLSLLVRDRDRTVSSTEPIVVAASNRHSTRIRSVLAYGLLRHAEIYNDTMIDATFADIQRTDSNEQTTISTIDSVLYRWDIDGDRDRVLGLLCGLLTQTENPIDIRHLEGFCHKLRGADGSLLGWFVFSLLLTAEHPLCSAAQELLPYQEESQGIDVDLTAMGVQSSWVLFAARKVLGYCLLKKEGAAGLLLACLRAVPDSNRTELEKLVFEYFLINYLDAIDLLEAGVTPGDSAADSVGRLALRLRDYVDNLEQLGTCPDFRPTEREQLAQAYQQMDFWRNVQKKAEEQSIFSIVAHKSILLYGTASIAYVQTGLELPPHRREMSLLRHNHVAQFPRLDLIDSVGLHYAIHRFRVEQPPS